jgi:hypothetical protein
MSTDLMNISAFKGMQPAKEFAVLDPHAESLADGIGSSYGIVGYKGKNWSLRLRGEQYNFVRGDDGSPLAFLDVIILRQLPTKSKSFYPPGSYVDGQVGTRPICAALDGITPDADIATPESSACAICPRNVFKVSADGRKTRDCSDYKRLAVLILPSLTKALLGAPLMEPVFLRVPAASLNDLALFGEGMSAQGFHYSSYVTRIGFNPEKAHPQMTFKALQALGSREAALVLPLREEATAKRITGENDIGKVASRPAQVIDLQAERASIDAAKQAAEAAAKQAAEAAQKAAEEKAAKIEADRIAAHKAAEAAVAGDLGFGDVLGDVTDTVTGPMTASIAETDGAATDVFGDVSGTTTVGVTAQPAQNTVADTGEPEESDVDLDARIAGILGK